MADQVFAPAGNTTLLAATTTSGRVVLSGTRVNYRVVNNGPDVVFVAQGDATIAAVIPTNGSPASGMLLVVGGVEVFSFVNGNNLAGICPTSTASLYITPGTGN